MTPIIELRDVDADNWRACADLEVVPEQRDFVSPVARYLCLCHFGGVWHPLAVYAGDEASAAALSRPTPAACWRPSMVRPPIQPVWSPGSSAYTASGCQTPPK